MLTPRGTSSPRRARLTTAALATLLIALRLFLDGSRLVSNPRAYWNAEEAHTAGVAWYAWHGGLWDQILNLQYKSFCGGCTVLGVIGAPVLGLGGDSFALWKGIALGWTALTLIAAFVAVDRGAGRAAAWAVLVALAVPPVGLSDVSLMLWGNHAESALLVAVAMALLPPGWNPSVLKLPTGPSWLGVGRACALGVWLGASVWFTRTTLYAVVVIVGIGVWRAASRRGPGREHADPDGPGLLALFAGFGLGASLLVIPSARGDAGYYDLSPLANVFPGGLPAGVQRGSALVRPAAMAAHLFRSLRGMEVLTTVWLSGVAVSLGFSLFVPRGRRMVPWVALVAVFALTYSMSGVPVTEAGPHSGVIHSRYQAPWMFLLLVVASAAAGEGIRAGGTARGLGVGIALALGVPSLVGWTASFRTAHVTPGLLDTAAVNHSDFAQIAAWRMTDERLASALGGAAAVDLADPGSARGRDVTRSWLGRMQGYRAAQVLRDDGADAVQAVTRAALAGLGSESAVEGYAEALSDPRAPWTSVAGMDLAALPPAYGRGVGFSLGLGRVEDDSNRGRGPRPAPATAAAAVQRAVDDLRSGLTPAEPCTACVAAGAVAITHCRQPIVEATADCLRRAVGEQPDADEVMYGAGVFCQKAGFPRSVCNRVPAGPIFAAGARDPMAGAEHPVRLVTGR